jgi:hypothetical protein
MWNPIATVPEDRELRLAVIDRTGEYQMSFPCRREGEQWVNSATGKAVDIHPTHWQDWTRGNQGPCDAAA